MRTPLRVFYAGLLGVTSGCVGDVELEGKACPCEDSYECDAVFGVCVAPGSTGVGQASAAVKPHNLRAEWSTGSAVRWGWDLGEQDDPDQLAGYRLVVAESEQAVLLSEGVVWAGSQDIATSAQNVNPELARYALPRTGDSEPVIATITDLHAADAVVFARLFATDTAGKQWATNVAQARTTFAPLPSDQVVLFSEADIGTELPPSYQVASGAAYQGSYAYEWVNATGTVFEQLRLQPKPPIPVQKLSEGEFETTAVFELALRVKSDSPSFWSEVWLRLPGGFSARLRPLTFRNDDTYRLIQVPLRVLRDKGSGPFLEYAQFELVDEISVGGFWSQGAIVRVDEIRIRW